MKKKDKNKESIYVNCWMEKSNRIIHFKLKGNTVMTTPLMITLNQIKENNICPITWDRILKLPDIPKDNYDKLFPLSTILNSNFIDDTLVCLKALPEHNTILANFAMFCIKETGVYSREADVYTCVNAFEGFLTDDISLEELRIAVNKADDYAYKLQYIDPIAYHATNTVTTIAHHYTDKIDYIYTIIKIACHSAHAAAHAYSEKSPDDSYRDLPFRAFADAYAAERQKQVNYLRKLLDG